MPLDFRSRDEEGFSVKRFLKTVGTGVAVFLIFMAIGYYGLGPRIMVSEDGRIQLRLTRAPENGATPQAAAPESKPMPKVVVHEKLPPDVTAGTGVLIGSREVAPFDYERYQQKRRERKPKSVAPADGAPTDAPPPIEDEYFVPDAPVESPAIEPPTETPAPEPPAPTPTEPTSPMEPAAPSRSETEPQENALYRVQVGVYESRENANQVAQSLLASGFDASIVPFQRDGKTLYRVQALVTRDRAKAEALKDQLASKGFPAVVVKAQ
jgi:cell division septation protein DedD